MDRATLPKAFLFLEKKENPEKEEEKTASVFLSKRKKAGAR